jgi:PAS domain S-box-containing protein
MGDLGQAQIEGLSAFPAMASDRARGEMGERIRAFDWSTTSLGPMAFWPQSLRTVVNILLSSRYAMWMAWGPDLTMLYNDAYRPTLGIKHPAALGMQASDVWAEIWPDISPRIETVLATGVATYDEGLLLFLERSGFPEETYHTFSYSPLADDSDRISGMLCVVTEETDRLIAERRVATLRDVASVLGVTYTEDQVLQALGGQLNLNKKDLPFTLTYLFDDNGVARLASSSGISSGHPLAPQRIERGRDFPWPAHQAFTDPAPRLIEDLSEQRQAAPLPAGDWNRPAGQAAIVPIRQQGQEQPAGFFIVGMNPYRRFDSAYSGFVDLLAGQIAAGLANARAYDAERRRAEGLAEIDRAKTTFFSNVSHELRTPLTLMLSPVEELLSDVRGQSPAQRDLLDLIHRNGLRLQKLVNTLLDFSRIEAGRMQAVYEPTDLSRLTEELASNFRSAMERAGLDFKIDCPPLPQPVYVDREMWEKIVLNLLSNALKFTLEGGVTVALAARGGCAELTVADTGTGIPESELPHIFERFHRIAGAKGRTIEGTGIGLALVQELVKLHDGAIVARSEVSKGSAFTVTIPFGTAHLPTGNIGPADGTASPVSRSDAFVKEALRWLSPGAPNDGWDGGSPRVPHTEHSSGTEARGERVLLADDNADMREYIARLLGERYRVETVSNGEEALQAALAEPPDIVLSDIMMPGLDGFGLLRELRASSETRTIPVVFLSARAGEESRVEGLGAGADDYLTKPFTARELLARVAAHLAMRRRTMDAEKALRESQATLQSFYDSSPFLMGVVELEGEQIMPIYCNTATARFYGADVDSMLSLSKEELGIPPAIDAIWLAHYRRSQSEGCSIHFEYEHPRSSGSCWLNACVNFLGRGHGGRPRFSFIAEDVTDRRANDERLRRSNEDLRQANADLEQFAYSASHDLQEPLRQIAIYSQMLEKKYASKLDGKASEYLGYCIEGAQRMAMLIRDLLAYSQVTKKSDASLEPVSIVDVLETVKKNLSATIEENQAEISSSGLPVVRGNPVPLVHLFQNLLSNALKYRSAEKPRVTIAATQDSGYWRFSVADNGIGIPKEFQTQIFGIFKRLHDRNEYPGTGIGLAICQKIVERSGGRIWVESEPGQGSTFFFTLSSTT